MLPIPYNVDSLLADVQSFYGYLLPVVPFANQPRYRFLFVLYLSTEYPPSFGECPYDAQQHTYRRNGIGSV
jgi:hypothetical protein